MSDIIARETAPQSINPIDCLKKIMKLPIERGCDWGVYAYVINKDIIDSEGNVDDLRAMIFHLGSFYDFEKAKQHAEKTIENTGYSKIIVAKYGLPVAITTKPSDNTIESVPVDIKGKLIKMETDEMKQQKKLYEEKIQYEKELYKECQDECDIDHIEHFKRQAYLATTHYTTYINLKQQSDKILKEFEIRKKLLNEHYNKHPEHEKQFLPFFKEKLDSRGENDLYLKIESNYLKYKHMMYEN
jgi:hypothetical protein